MITSCGNNHPAATQARSDEGFTLIETLVALMVLSFTAIILSVTLSTSFKSYTAIKESGSTLSQSQALSRLMREAGRTQYYGGGQQGLTFDEARFELSAHAALDIVASEGVWSVNYVGASNEHRSLWQSSEPLRFDVQRRGASRSVHLQAQHFEDWQDILSAPLIVSAPAQCRFDIVLRRCQS